jgi:hypothetical protein
MTERFAVGDDTSSLSFSMEPPLLTIVDIDGADPARPRLDWTVSTPGPVGDAILIDIRWDTPGPDYNWTIHLPPDTRTFTLPELPENLAVSPLDDSVTYLEIQVEFSEDSFFDGFADHKANLNQGVSFTRATASAGYRISSSHVIRLRHVR